MTTSPPRKPRVIETGHPGLEIEEPVAAHAAGDAGEAPPEEAAATGLPTAADVQHGIRWGALLLAAMAGLATISASLAFTRFVSSALERDDWIGWTATVLAGVALFSLAVILLRELIGLWRLARLGRLRKSVEAALRDKDLAGERKVVSEVKGLFAGRHDLRWGLARLAEHAGDVRDPGALLRLADRELLAPLDREARRIVLKSAKRVSVVTAMSPMVLIAMAYVVVENLRLLRTLAGLYGGRPGGIGALKLARLVIQHIVATGGLALTDDLLGQFLGQDLLRRLSRRLGEGAFNGAMTARVGVAAIEVTRPLPFLDAEPVRIRDLLPELFRRTAQTAKAGKT